MPWLSCSEGRHDAGASVQTLLPDQMGISFHTYQYTHIPPCHWWTIYVAKSGLEYSIRWWISCRILLGSIPVRDQREDCMSSALGDRANYIIESLHV